jgi:diguanylate cyclase (GGDEF)-like protein
MTVENLTTPEPALRLASQLHLTADWAKNTTQIAALVAQAASGVEVAAFWSLHGSPAYFTANSEDVFGSALSGLKRADVVQSRTLVPWGGLDDTFAIAVAMGESSLGMMVMRGPDEALMASVAQALLPQLALAQYATQLVEEVDKRTSTDKLTKLWNRLYFNERFREECERLATSKEVGSVAILGLDDLGAMSRVLGTDESGKILAQAGAVVRRLVRQTDWVVHWDSHEFLFYFPNTLPEQALDVFNRCLTQLHASHPLLQGVVGLCSSQETTSARTLIQLAARRLELARKDGHKHVVCFASKASGLQFYQSPQEG